MNLTLPIFGISGLSLIDEKFTKLCGLLNKPLKKLKVKPKPVNKRGFDASLALLDKKSGLTKIVGRYRSELHCEGKLKLPIAPKLKEEFDLEETEILKPPWRIPSLVS